MTRDEVLAGLRELESADLGVNGLWTIDRIRLSPEAASALAVGGVMPGLHNGHRLEVDAGLPGDVWAMADYR